MRLTGSYRRLTARIVRYRSGVVGLAGLAGLVGHLV